VSSKLYGVLFIAAVACRSPQSTDPNITAPDGGTPAESAHPNDAAGAVPDGDAPASAASAATTSTGDARTTCADAAKEQRFLDTHKGCKVDDDCTLKQTWLYPCGMPIQKSAIRDLETVDRSVSIACMKIGFHAPERDCTTAVLRAGCSRGSCGNVVPFPH
jgi:hypothetical protein